MRLCTLCKGDYLSSRKFGSIEVCKIMIAYAIKTVQSTKMMIMGGRWAQTIIDIFILAQTIIRYINIISYIISFLASQLTLLAKSFGVMDNLSFGQNLLILKFAAFKDCVRAAANCNFVFGHSYLFVYLLGNCVRRPGNTVSFPIKNTVLPNVCVGWWVGGQVGRQVVGRQVGVRVDRRVAGWLGGWLGGSEGGNEGVREKVGRLVKGHHK